MKVTHEELKKLIPLVWKGKGIPMLHGSPGIGKSYICRELAEEYKLKVIDVRLSQTDPITLNGLINFNSDKTKSNFVPLDIFPTEADEVPEGYAGWLIFLDELNAAPPSVQCSAYKLLDGYVGQTKLHKKVVFLAAGNLSTDKAVVTRQSTASKSRLIHFELDNSIEGFTSYMIDKEFDPRIIAYLTYRSDHFHKFDPDTQEHTFPCNRTWEFVNNMTKSQEDLKAVLPVIAGAIGDGVAIEYVEYTAVFNDLPSIADILVNPETAKIPTDSVAKQFAITTHLATKLTKENIEKASVYIDRLPKELSILCYRMAVRRDRLLINSPVLDKWIKELNAYVST